MRPLPALVASGPSMEAAVDDVVLSAGRPLLDAQEEVRRLIQLWHKLDSCSRKEEVLLRKFGELEAIGWPHRLA